MSDGSDNLKDSSRQQTIQTTLTQRRKQPVEARQLRQCYITNILCHAITRLGIFIHGAVSSSLDRSKRFTLHPLSNMFIPASNRLLWEEFSHVAITARRLFPVVKREKMPKVCKGSKGDSNRGSLIDSQAFHCLATMQ